MKRQFLNSICIAALGLSLSACSPSSDTNSMTKTAPAAPVTTAHDGPALDTHLYLEEVLGETALAKVEGWNSRSLKRLTADPLFEQMQAEALEILNSKEKIPYVSYRAGAVHNFWQDADHVRGIWRTATLDSYLSDDPQWSTILDYDALAETEGKNWVYKGNSCLAPDYNQCMISLSDGGKDAVVRREFNAATGEFVKDGFVTSESKGSIDWLDADTLLVSVDFGDGSMTDSGYPRTARLWKRGTPLSDAPEIFSGDASDIGVGAYTLELEGGRREILAANSKTFYDREYVWIAQKDGKLSAPVRIPVSLKTRLVGNFKGQFIAQLNDEWRGFKTGDMVSFSIKDFMESGEIKDIHLIYAPDAASSIEDYGITKSKILMSIYTDVTGAAFAYDWDGSSWSRAALDFPKNGSVSIRGTNDSEDVAFISTESFLSPDTLWTINADTLKTRKAKSLPEWFDASSMQADQHFTTSTDGTKVPYFIVRKKNLKMDGSNPTLLYGYGGFRISMLPSYSATRGKLWVERGGVYVLSNIRGGAEYGPAWHAAGLKTERQKIYDDFIAVAEDLIESGITSPDHLGIEGGSNGGLLMGVMTTQRPDLFNAVVCAVPLLDMMRYHTLLAGASWVGEYGNPEDAVEGAFLRSISPYHNMRGAVDYPEVFFVTSTKDDRVHPGHARKMAARMEDLGKSFLYYENIDGGHSASANLKETAKRLALQHTYLMQKLR